jgi:hypothetical protein
LQFAHLCADQRRAAQRFGVCCAHHADPAHSGLLSQMGLPPGRGVRATIFPSHTIERHHHGSANYVARFCARSTRQDRVELHERTGAACRQLARFRLNNNIGGATAATCERRLADKAANHHARRFLFEAPNCSHPVGFEAGPQVLAEGVGALRGWPLCDAHRESDPVDCDAVAGAAAGH